MKWWWGLFKGKIAWQTRISASERLWPQSKSFLKCPIPKIHSRCAQVRRPMVACPPVNSRWWFLERCPAGDFLSGESLTLGPHLVIWGISSSLASLLTLITVPLPSPAQCTWTESLSPSHFLCLQASWHVITFLLIAGLKSSLITLFSAFSLLRGGENAGMPLAQGTCSFSCHWTFPSWAWPHFPVGLICWLLVPSGHRSHHTNSGFYWWGITMCWALYCTCIPIKPLQHLNE